MFNFIKKQAEIINHQASKHKEEAEENCKVIVTEVIDIPISHYDLICKIKTDENSKTICKILQEISKVKNTKEWWNKQHSFIRHTCAEISKDTLLKVINKNQIVLNNDEKSIILNKFYKSDKSRHIQRHILGSALNTCEDEKDFDTIIEIIIRKADVDKICEKTYIEIICIAIIYLQIPDDKLEIYASRKEDIKWEKIDSIEECNDYKELT